MNKTAKIIISLAAAVVIIAVVLVFGIVKNSQDAEKESTTKYSLQSTTTAPSTTQPLETESWVDIEQIASDLATSTETETTSEVTISIPEISVQPQTTIVYVYVSEVTQAPTTTTKPNNAGPEMSEYKYTVNSEAGTVTINRYLGNDTSIILPKTISGYPVTAIADRCFENENIKAIGIQEGLTSIGKDAFKNCKNLESVSFLGVPYSVTVGDSAFEGCEKLKNINLPAARSIGNYAFLGCSSLKSLTLKSGTETIGDSCFENCSSLTEIVIPSSVSAIGTGSFNGHNEKLVIKCVEDSVAHEIANKYAVSVDFIIE